MGRTHQPEMHLDKILKTTPASAAQAIARATGLTVGQLCNERLGSLTADQLRALCLALDLGTDALLGTGAAQVTEEEANLLHAYRVTDERGRRSMRSIAEFAAQWRDGHNLRIIDGVKNI